MSFPTGFGMCLILLPTLLTLPEPGFTQCYSPTPRTPGFVAPPCCTEVSAIKIRESIACCYEHKETTFHDCNKHAFIFETQDKRRYCVDPAATWLPKRFRTLQQRGICCLVL